MNAITLFTAVLLYDNTESVTWNNQSYFYTALNHSKSGGVSIHDLKKYTKLRTLALSNYYLRGIFPRLMCICISLIDSFHNCLLFPIYLFFSNLPFARTTTDNFPYWLICYIFSPFIDCFVNNMSNMTDYSRKSESDRKFDFNISNQTSLVDKKTWHIWLKWKSYSS